MIGKSIIIILVESIFLSFIPILKVPITEDVLTNCIIGGVLEGIGISLTCIGFGIGGGTDILGLIISKKFKNMSVGKVSFGINLIIYIICAFIFSLEISIYSFLASIISSIVIDKLHLQNNSVSVNIFSQNYEEISKMIIEELNRDATILDGVGVYSQQEKN